MSEAIGYLITGLCAVERNKLMSDSYMVITKKDWEEANEKLRGWMLFNTVQNMNCRLKKLEKRPIIDKVYSFAGGIIGGALAYLGIKIA